MRRLLAAWLVALGTCAAQAPPAPQMPEREQQDLAQALGEAGSSPLEQLRAIEKHLQKYPDSSRKADLEKGAMRAAKEVGDDARTALYGERVLAREPEDLQALEPVTRALLAAASKENAAKALTYARRYEGLIRKIQEGGALAGVSPADFRNQTAQALGRVLTFEARASRTLERLEEASGLARRAFETFPSAESAREAARCFEALGKPEEAARRLADAFTVQDAQTTDSAREGDRIRMGELWRAAKGSEAGLGDMVLEAFDRNAALTHARELAARALDPNLRLTDPMQFTLSALEGPRLSMESLKGKVVALDFWATWCAPCRVQHPLLEKVEQQFAGDPGVVFVSVNADENREAVRPFLAEVKWAGPVYFEDGLARALKIGSLPTTVIIDKRGRVVNRMEGFAPDRFADMLTERIREAAK